MTIWIVEYFKDDSNFGIFAKAYDTSRKAYNYIKERKREGIVEQHDLYVRKVLVE